MMDNKITISELIISMNNIFRLYQEIIGSMLKLKYEIRNVILKMSVHSTSTNALSGSLNFSIKQFLSI
jgi:hypothetical protein